MDCILNGRSGEGNQAHHPGFTDRVLTQTGIIRRKGTTEIRFPTVFVNLIPPYPHQMNSSNPSSAPHVLVSSFCNEYIQVDIVVVIFLHR